MGAPLSRIGRLPEGTIPACMISSLAQVSHGAPSRHSLPGRAVTIDGVGVPAHPRAGFAQPRERSRGGRPGACRGDQLVDFPGIVAGDTFEIVKGSKVGRSASRARPRSEHLDDDSAAFHVRGGRFGIKLDVDVDDRPHRRRHRPDQGERHWAADPYQTEARIVANRTNFVDFEHLGSPEGHTVFSSDGPGHVVIDTVLPTFGDVHLELERR